jgi:hypothetical protein
VQVSDLEDRELFRLERRLGAEDFTRRQVRRVYTRFGDFFLDHFVASPTGAALSSPS